MLLWPSQNKELFRRIHLPRMAGVVYGEIADRVRYSNQVKALEGIFT